ncbi:chemotaxis response regulator protein-glutamate methylesterase [Candidatus Accumulibacter sp. ACC003]|uniref:protein-glutamate methylesterase/protein-glutamine glutaminase n=1 Tax=Candidatus Accumulibacter sp. ACC003 TaxID=2823334 RepID=UPI0025C7166C|nr:chemotaxis response regulator protein-glutamate methylesterase [Candidatus Accumulibacter sp. ACC003]
MSERRIKLMVADDSTRYRQFVTQALASDPAIDVTAITCDALLTIAQMRKCWPDVLLLDIETPRMDGLAFVRRVLAERQTPIVICSSPANLRSPATLAALAAGAVSVVGRPGDGPPAALERSAAELARTLHAAAAPPRRQASPAAPTAERLRAKYSADVMLAAARPGAVVQRSEQIVAIGTSAGGTQALEVVLTQLPSTCHGLVIVQHMPERFTAMLAQRLDELCQIDVREASDGDRVRPGLALIAPGGKHLLLKRSGTHYQVEVADGPLVSRHKPSVDVLFRSVARFAGGNALGIIMTGMGDDGACGLREMRDAGARTIAQDEASCVVFGMPKEAIKLDAAERIVGLQQIAGAIVAFGRLGATPGVSGRLPDSG